MIRIIPTSFFVLFLFFSCKKNESLSGTIENLTFTVDTIFFDTLFTEIPNITKAFKVYNNSNEDVLIERLFLKNNSNVFSLNINGTILNSEIKNIKIKAQDSIWCFAKVNFNANNEINPFIIEDELILQYGNNQNKLKLLAWGQNANYYRGLGEDRIFNITENTIWNSDLPYIIIGICKVTNQSILSIKKNTKVYFYNNSAITIDEGSSLKILGEKEHPVTFKPTRTEDFMSEISGQWRGVFLNKNSINNEINYLQLYNAQIGIKADSSLNLDQNHLIIRNSIIQNCSQYGIWSNNSSFIAYNLLIYNCEINALRITNGGKFNLYHSTLASYKNSLGINSSALSISGLGFKDESEVYNNIINSGVYNSIIAGTVLPQIIIVGNENVNYQINFSYVLAPSNIDLLPGMSVNNLITNNNPLFKNTKNYNLQENSPAILKGNKTLVTNNLIELQYDLNGVDRLSAIQPDLGCFQYKKE